MSISFPAASELAHHATDAATRALAQSQALALRGSRQLRDQASRVRHNTVGYIQDEPLKSVLIAAAAGAALVCLTRLVWGAHED